MAKRRQQETTDPSDFDLSAPTEQPKKAPRSEINRAIKLFHDEHVKRHGVKPLINGGKHAALLGAMIATWTEPVVAQLIADFVWGNDPWAVKCGWTVEAFYHVAPRMMTRAQQIDERTAANVDAARRATQRRS